MSKVKKMTVIAAVAGLLIGMAISYVMMVL